VGELLALGCAVVWGIAVILFKRSGETVPPLALNLFRTLLSTPLLIATTAISGTPLVRAASSRDYLLLIASGVLGIALSDTLFHRSLNRIGAGITAIIDTFYPLITIIFAFALLGERMEWKDVVGMALIMAAVFVSATLAPPPGCTRRRLVQGILIGLAGLSLLALGIVIAKPVLDQAPVLWVASVRQTAAVLALLAGTTLAGNRREVLRSLRPSASWRWMVPGTIAGSYLSLLMWIGSMKYAKVGVSAILTQSSTLFILLFAVLFLGERLTPRKIASAVLAISGVLVVTIA